MRRLRWCLKHLSQCSGTPLSAPNAVQNAVEFHGSGMVKPVPVPCGYGSKIPWVFANLWRTLVDVDWEGVKQWKFTPFLIVNVAEAMYVSSQRVYGNEKVHLSGPSKNLDLTGRRRGTPCEASTGFCCHHSLHSVLRSAKLENRSPLVCAIRRLRSCPLPTLPLHL